MKQKEDDNKENFVSNKNVLNESQNPKIRPEQAINQVCLKRGIFQKSCQSICEGMNFIKFINTSIPFVHSKLPNFALPRSSPSQNTTPSHISHAFIPSPVKNNIPKFDLTHKSCLSLQPDPSLVYPNLASKIPSKA